MRKIFLAILVALCSMLYVPSVFAQYGQYGNPGPSYTVLINKLVAMPTDNNNFVDNLSPSDPRFGPNQDVYFKLIVKNTSNITLSNFTVKDFVPADIEPIEGPGSYDSNTRTISFNIGDLAPDEEKSYILKMRVHAQNKLPSDKGLFCEVNRAQVYNIQVSDDDTAQLCIEKKVTGVIKVPSSGPEFGLILLGANLFGIGAGLYLKRKI